MATFTSVISSEYCLPKSIKLKIDTAKGVTYVNDEVAFRVEAPSLSLHHRRVLSDVSGNPVFTLYKQRLTVNGRWEVFRGGNTDSTDLLFSVKRPALRHKKNIDLDVFLAKNTKESSVWDFKVNAGTDKKSCDVCAHGSSTPLAKMTNNKGTFEVELQPNVDYAFIAALLTIVDEIDTSKFDTKIIKDGAEVAGPIAGAAATTAQVLNDYDDDDDDENNDDQKM